MLLLFTIVSASWAQELETAVTEDPPAYNQAWELRHDNDFLQFTDRYYTSGTFLGMHTNFKSDTDSLTHYQYRLYVRQEIYTPADLEETDPSRIGRPYAGFLGFDNALVVFKDQRLFDYHLYLGWSGPQSLAENFRNMV